MITYLSALASLFFFRFRSRASLELELLALQHPVTGLRRQRLGRARLFCARLSPIGVALSNLAAHPNGMPLIVRATAIVFTRCAPKTSFRAAITLAGHFGGRGGIAPWLFSSITVSMASSRLMPATSFSRGSRSRNLSDILWLIAQLPVSPASNLHHTFVNVTMAHRYRIVS